MTSLTPLRILVVEDCEDDYDLLILKLRGAGYDARATRVETLSEISAALPQTQWQMVFSDYDLPGFDGLRVLQMVRAHDPEMPFFLVSGVVDEEQAVIAMKAGAQDYFFKGKLARLGPAVARELSELDARSKRREAETALDRDRNLLRHDRIRFVDVMSHEFRTPLNIINVAAGILARYGERMDAATRKERTAEIQDAVARITRMIDKVLLTSRLELQRWDLRAETFDPCAWLDQFLMQNFSDAMSRKRLEVRSSNMPPLVAIDPRVVELALQNILSNALKYSSPESPVELGMCGCREGQVRFTVRDHGIGIPESDLASVADSFYRGSNVGDVPGTGLGLTIVKGCMDVHDGRLGIVSSPGQGTTVTLTLPDWLKSKASCLGSELVGR